MTVDIQTSVAEGHTTNNAFTLTIDDNQMAWLAVDVPNEKMNTLQAAFADQMQGIFQQLEKQKSNIKGMIVHSLKPDNFIAGADVRMLDACQSAQEAESLGKQGQEMFNQLANLPFTVVAAIHGPCLGGGLELALACDYRVCSDDNGTRLGLPEVQLGLLPGSGGTQRLPRLIGLLDSLDLILTGKQVRAKKALKLGLADACVPKTILLQAAQEFIEKSKRKIKPDVKEKLMANTGFGRKVIFDQASKKANQKSRGNYPAIKAILNVIQHGLEKGMVQGLEKEAQEFGKLVMTPESRALRSIFFATTEMKKDFGSNAKPKNIQSIGVLGGGLMGAGIAYVSATKAHVPVRVKDVSNDGILHAMNYSYKLLSKLAQRRAITQAQLQKQMQSISGGTDFTGFSKKDMVIEAVFEDLNLKQSMVRDVQTHAKEDVIFATNTSSLPISNIAKGALKPENVIGLHYFSPVDKMPLVEVIPHEGTSDEVIATTVKFARKQGKTPIVVKDKAGFYVNRILAPYMNEAAKVLLSGEPIEHIDESLLNFGFPVGPIALLDEVGVDIGAKITPILVEELGERFKAPDVFETLLKDNRKGRKSGKGFYSYKGKKKEVDKSVYRLLNVSPESILSEEVISMRCVLLMINEAVRALDDGIIASPRDGDIGAIFGIGFPPFLGGPFRYVDQIGADKLVEIMNEYTEKYGSRFAPCDGLLTRAGTGDKFYP
ncbi:MULTISPECIES: fatty acid oxidation complex subunit alpha FadJ [Vibrio]|uniref:enoyl-CoA hydratase n=1 Tax=Vibrio casei TaxID=673372 RepID=A0A368LQ49_9VIBR|nr:MULTISPECIES: fatty acid oxidation complex subunit alpha FadJ [Vibrio]RCS73613.1 fatty acid oxidation complex subunit alpha FadJ [Vibrio casei]SJN16896.1 Enoyl-CoA hydratase / Delta(3)-cis-delta(2)-trans-enoyl-CoA isomerase / 3-hydroxyacyl-CoA dehydrogenase / 3-hydroxybutyryl-CoA epimerase [Vibrio casei]HBV76341.1 fatty acid oxidation complex subunit alpha FadJ [Vibrio sp.]